MSKAENIRQFQDFCKRNFLIEDSNTASFFCEMYRRKATKSNSIAIAQIYKYIEYKEV